MSKKLTTVEFVARCRVTHGDKYEYTKTNYVNQKTKVVVTCPIHGDWECLPHNHSFHGNGCPICGTLASTKMRSLTHNDFVQLARSIHGDRYQYPDKYQHSQIPMQIICPDHGSFLMKPNAHTSQKQGCPRCAGKYQSKDEWVKAFRRTHGNKYQYVSPSITANVKTMIVCSIHGVFDQLPTMHRFGQGCPSCAYHNHKGRYSNLFFDRHSNKKDIPAIIYVWEMSNDTEHFIKVGITTTSVEQRIRNNKSQTYKINAKFQQALSLYDAFILEQKILDSFIQFAYVPGEQFHGRTECLLPSCYHDIINYIKENNNVESSI